MKQAHSLTKRWFLPVLIATVLSGCIGDQYTENTPAEEDTYLLVELKIPGVSTPASRAFADNEQEKQISELDVLVFRDNGTGYPETFAYHTQGTLVSDKQYQVKVKRSTPRSAKYRLVFLANLHSEVIGAMSNKPEKFSQISTKAETLEAITFDAAEVWNTTITPLRYLPMWGESESTYVITMEERDIEAVYMLRSVARVDVLLNPVSDSSPEVPNSNGFNGNLFKLKSVKVYNASSMGTAAPQVEVSGMYSDAMKVNAPSVPTDADPVSFEYIPTPVQQAKGVMQSIYIAESVNTTGTGENKVSITDITKMTCLVISGNYNGASALSWYRLDFIENPDKKFLRRDILRNHCYMFNITDVNGPGYPNEVDAFESQPIHINYTTLWSDEKIEATIDQTQYTLSVSQGVFTLSGEAHDASGTDNTFTVTTNHPDGWEVDEITYAAGSQPDWLDWASGTTADEVKLIIRTENNSTTNSTNMARTGYIHLLAGTLTYKVKVTQDFKP